MPHGSNAINSLSQHTQLHRHSPVAIVIDYLMLGNSATKILPSAALAESFALLLLVGSPLWRDKLASSYLG